MDSVGGGGGSRNFSGIPILWGEGVVAQIFRDPYSVGGKKNPLTPVTYPQFVFFSVNCSTIPSIRVIQTCIVFSPNNVDSLPELMSTNCPNGGGGSCPPLPPSRTPMVSIVVEFHSSRYEEN